MGTTTVLTWPLVGRTADLERIVSALADDSVRVVHLVGDAGTGKSRLAEEALRGAELDGYPVAHVAASEAAAVVPLSALSPLLPSGTSPALDPGAVLDSVVDHVRELGDGARVVVHVDDIDQLDVVSADLLARLWRDGLVAVVATQRTGTATPGVLMTEQRRGGVLRIDLGDLPRPSASSLLHHVLRGPVSAGAEHALWDVAQGNPLYLRELVTSAVLADRLAPVDGVWVLDGALDVSGGLAGLVAERIGHLDADERDLVELLALCAPLGVDELAAHARLDVLESLEAGGVIRVSADRRRQLVTLAHPVHVQVLRGSLPRLKARRLLLDQVARTEAHGSRRRDDVLRVAAWRLDATGTADPRLLVAGAELARTSHDYLQVERLARAALLLEPDAVASTLLGEALYEQGRFDEADETLASAAAALGDDQASGDAVRIALMHGIVLFFGLGRSEAALDRLGAASSAVAGAGLTDDEAAERTAVLESMRALLLTQGGRSREALDALPAEPPSDPVMRAVHARAHAWAHYRTGEAEAAAESALAAWEAGIREDAPAGLLHPAGDLMVAALAHLELGRPEEARALAAKGRDVAIAQGVPFQAAWLAWAVATVDLVMGYAEDAEAAFRELAATAGRGGFAQVEHLAALGLTECRALTGDAAGAHAWFDRAEALPAAAPAFAPATVMARAWLASADGDTRQAAALLHDAGLELAARDELREAAVLLDEAVMFGDRDAAEALLVVIDRVPTPVGRARRLRAQALLTGAPSDLLAAAEGFAGCGFVHSAATMAARAAQVLRADGDPRAAAAAEAQARAWADLSPGIQVEGLGSTAGAALLTPREREISSLVARGRSSKEVATDLVLSVRTIDNHLANVYAKLGIAGRAQLAPALGLVDAATAVPAARSGRDR
ncbi:LuxR C-terminal-related transcriptional regulator [Longivirga aurantiaca]|uniref:LuxR C-terminal-related transcriptional regulator n=1 Tax=Longivirga aurantiaca TaxID=1837743 RepID=A0ABW1SZB4_9ACTN